MVTQKDKMAYPELDYEKLIERIRYIMDSLQLTPSSFAEKMNMAPSRIINIFKGRNNPSLEVVYSICRFFPDWSYSWILFGEGEPMVKDNQQLDILSSDLFDTSYQNNVGVNNNRLPSLDASTAIHKEIRLLREELKKTEADERKVQEIRIFYTDGSFEVFKKV